MSAAWRRGVAITLVALLAAAAVDARAGVRVLVVGAGVETMLVAIGDAAPYLAEREAGPAGYALVAAGTHRIALGPAAEDEQRAPSAWLAMVDVDLEAGSYYTLIVSFPSVAGLDAPAWQAQRAETELLLDEIATLPPAGQASLRVAHAAPFVGELSITLWPSGADDRSDPDGGDRVAGEDGDESADEPTEQLRLDPLGSSARFDLPEGAYDVQPSRADEPRRAGPIRIDLRGGVAYTLYLTEVAPGEAGGRLVVDAARPEPAQRERE